MDRKKARAHNPGPNCFANDHMTMRQYGLWTKVREIQKKFKHVFFDGDEFAGRFQSTSRDIIYRECNALINSGWFQVITRCKRKKDGTWEARRIRALSQKSGANSTLKKVLLSVSKHTCNWSVLSSRTNATNQLYPCN